LCRYCFERPPEVFRSADATTVSRAIGACFYLGHETGRRPCETCRGHVEVKVFACAHPLHQETTAAECHACKDFSPRLDRAFINSWAVAILSDATGAFEPAIHVARMVELGWNESQILVAHGDGSTSAHRWLEFLATIRQRFDAVGGYLLIDANVPYGEGRRDARERFSWPAERLAAVFWEQRRTPSELSGRTGTTGAALPSGCVIIPAASLTRFLDYLGRTSAAGHPTRSENAGLCALIHRWSEEAGLPTFVFNREENTIAHDEDARAKPPAVVPRQYVTHVPGA